MEDILFSDFPSTTLNFALKKKKKKKVHPLCRGRDVLETEGLSPGGERHSVTLGNQMCGAVAQGGLKCEPR